MAVYLIAQIKIFDRERYTEYEDGFMEIFSQYQGKILSVDEAPESLEGDWPCTRTVLLEFPSKGEANAWYTSDDYQKLAEHRFASSEANIIIIEGLADTAGEGAIS